MVVTRQSVAAREGECNGKRRSDVLLRGRRRMAKPVVGADRRYGSAVAVDLISQLRGYCSPRKKKKRKRKKRKERKRKKEERKRKKEERKEKKRKEKKGKVGPERNPKLHRRKTTSRSLRFVVGFVALAENWKARATVGLQILGFPLLGS